VKFLVDNQLPVALAHWLSARGHDAVHVLEQGQAQTDDRQIWQDAIAAGRIVVSKDEDFFILATRPADAGRLLWMRIGNCRTEALLAALEHAWPIIEQTFASGQKLVELR
jgi:predicted nuclease of predicted toxin-antitoxin system